MNYGVGDTVVCIDALPLDDIEEQIFCGKQYVVAYLDIAGSCVGLVGIYDEYYLNGACVECGSDNRYSHYDSWRFIKLDQVTARTSSDRSEVV